MGLPGWRIGCLPGHNHLDRSGVIIIAVPLWAELHDRSIEGHADTSAHADDHALADKCRDAVLEMLYEVFGHKREALFRADQRLDSRPLPLEPILFLQGLILCQIRDLGINLGPLFLVELDPRQSAFVIDRDRRTIFDRAAYV